MYKRRKQAQTSWMLKNKKVKSIFLLNDTWSCNELNTIYKTDKFKYLGDPVTDFTPAPDFDLRFAYHIPAGNKIFLHVGTIEPRKGTLEIIDSLKYIDESIRANLQIIIIGKASKSFEQVIRQKIEEIKTSGGENIIYENTFLENDRLKSLFEQVDFILMPYKNTEASSGILGHAIINRKPVIGPKQGLLGNLIAQNKLGYLLDSVDSVSIAKAITTCFYAPPEICNEEMRLDYLDSHTSDKFATIILEQLKLG
jgi:glycosyltransferase involved in cell wall biosynthesis